MPPIPTYAGAGSGPEFCSLENTDRFVAAYEANETIISMPQVGLFRSKQVPVAFQISCEGHLRVDGKTTLLSSFSPGPDEFAVTPELHALQLPVKAGSGSLFLMLVHDIPPYPPGARSRHAGGQVKFDLVIGEDGRVASHTLVEAAQDPELTQAVEISLTHQIFRPYLIDGVAVPFKATTVMNYGIAP